MATNIRIRYDVNNQELSQSRKNLKEIRKDVGQTEKEFQNVNKEQRNMQKETKKSESAFGGLKQTVAGLGIAATIGAGVTAMGMLVQRTNDARKAVAQLTRTSGGELDRITSKVLATASVFKKDYNEVLNAANTVSKNFGKTMTESLDLINEGFVRGADANGEFLNILREYPTLLKEVGLNATQTLEVLETQAQQGIYSDKGIDAIKEANLRLRELTPAAQDALDAIGFSSEEIQRQLETGSKSTFEVIQDISERMSELPPQSQAVGQAIADIFGGPGEDAGLRFLTTLQDIDGELGEVTGEAGRYAEQQRNLVDSQESLNSELIAFSKAFEPLGNQIKIFTNETLADLLGSVNTFINSFKDARGVIESIAGLSLEAQRQEIQEQLELEKERLQDIKDAYIVVGGKQEEIEKSQQRINELNQLWFELTKQIQQGKEDQEQTTDNTANNEKRTTNEQEKQVRLQTTLNELKRKGLETDFDISGPDRGPIPDIPIEQVEQQEQEKFDIRREMAFRTHDLIRNIMDLEAQSREQELQDVRDKEQQKLQAYRGNEQAQRQVRRETASEEKRIRNEQAQAAKRNAVFQTLLQQGPAIAKTIGNLGFPAAIPFVALAGAQIGTQIATTRSQSVPQFAEGTKNVQGGQQGRDSVPAYLMPGEGVMPVDKMNKYRPAFNAMYDNKIDPEIINAIATGNQPEVNVNNDLSPVAKALKNQPRNVINMDRKGFTQHIHRAGNVTKKQSNRFSWS